MIKSIFFCTLFLAGFLAQAGIHTETIEYKQGDTVLQGYVAYDDKLAAKRPGIVVVHDWMGPGAFAKKRAEELAALGYTAFAADIYGKDLRPKDTKEAGEAANKFKNDRNLLRARVQAAFDELLKHKTVDKNKTGVMGFCFGGTTALELARSGAPVSAVISFHGGLDSPTPADAKNIKGQLLVLHGADDPWVPVKEVAAFEKEMKDAKVKYQLIKYPGAVHAFTNPEAGNDPKKGAAYNADADEKSRNEMRKFFSSVFTKKM